MRDTFPYSLYSSVWSLSPLFFTKCLGWCWEKKSPDNAHTLDDKRVCWQDNACRQHALYSRTRDPMEASSSWSLTLMAFLLSILVLFSQSGIIIAHERRRRRRRRRRRLLVCQPWVSFSVRISFPKQGNSTRALPSLLNKNSKNSRRKTKKYSPSCCYLALVLHHLLWYWEGDKDCQSILFSYTNKTRQGHHLSWPKLRATRLDPIVFQRESITFCDRHLTQET